MTSLPFSAMTMRRRALFLLAAAGLAVAAFAPASGIGATGSTVAKPRNMKIMINGSTLSAAQTKTGADEYLSVRQGRLTVGARWTGNLKGSGYYILIADSSSGTKVRCRAGTSCTAASKTGIKKAQEMTWSIQVIRSSTGVMVSQKIVCLAGVA